MRPDIAANVFAKLLSDEEIMALYAHDQATVELVNQRWLETTFDAAVSVWRPSTECPVEDLHIFLSSP
jgi:hypothetical protein